MNNVQKILTHSLASEKSDEKLNVKLEEIFKSIQKEKTKQIERVDEKFKEFLSAVKEKYKTIKNEIEEIYLRTEEEIKSTYKGLTSLVNIVGRSTRQITSFLTTDHRYAFTFLIIFLDQILHSIQSRSKSKSLKLYIKVNVC